MRIACVLIFAWCIVRVQCSPMGWTNGQSQMAMSYAQNLNPYGQNQNSQNYGQYQSPSVVGQGQGLWNSDQSNWSGGEYKHEEEEEEESGIDYVLLLTLFLIPILYDTLNPPTE